MHTSILVPKSALCLQMCCTCTILCFATVLHGSRGICKKIYVTFEIVNDKSITRNVKNFLRLVTIVIVETKYFKDKWYKKSSFSSTGIHSNRKLSGFVLVACTYSHLVNTKTNTNRLVSEEINVNINHWLKTYSLAY